ncbi:MAG: adenylyl-sulfate kinase [Myxococcales bacterium]|nr:adenylyl-sulfate kinase [Myxococcales bacterium]
MAATLWFTGLPSAGKTTLATAVREALRAKGARVLLLDGDEVRRTLSADLGFDAASRDENVRRCAAVASLATASDVFSLVALVSPRREARDQARRLHAEQRLAFFEVFLSASLEACEARDPKGLYVRARRGLAKDVTGIDAPYEPPLGADLVVPPEMAVGEAAAAVLALIAG